jgi:glutathionylspermidine synthase
MLRVIKLPPLTKDLPTHKTSSCAPIAFGPAVIEERFREVQNRMALDLYKWDMQVGDTSTLFPQPLFITPDAWLELSRLAENLAAELHAAEQELLARPELEEVLGLPAPFRSILQRARQYGCTPAAGRILRFDFHYTRDGWRISEVNSDVPGGYTEASSFTELMATLFPGTRTTGNPTRQWTEAILSSAGQPRRIALLSAPGFLEDQQVTAFLSSQLHSLGAETVLLHHPSQLNWKAGRASAIAKAGCLEIDAIVRFYQGEWLLKLPERDTWRWLFAEGKTPVTNPGTALLTESKRFPLVWDQLSTKMVEWRNLLPECCDPAAHRWQDSDEWVLKEAFSNTGDSVHTRESTGQREWMALCHKTRQHPNEWMVQHRFEICPISSDVGFVYPCMGVYTVNGRAAGCYARVSKRPIIDYAAMDVAVLLREISTC